MIGSEGNMVVEQSYWTVHIENKLIISKTLEGSSRLYGKLFLVRLLLIKMTASREADEPLKDGSPLLSDIRYINRQLNFNHEHGSHLMFT